MFMHGIWVKNPIHHISLQDTTFPITLRTSASVDGKQITQADTYVVCIECGGHFAYDWTTMRITRHRAAWVRRWPGLGRISVKNDVSRTAIESIRLIREYGRMAAVELPHDRKF